MDHIAIFLERFKLLDTGEREFKKIIAHVLQETLSLQIPLEDIVCRGGEVSVRASSSLKNELFIHKEEIVTKVNNLLSKRRIQGIH